MYRQNEDPYLLSKTLNDLKEQYTILIEEGADGITLFELNQEIEVLEERVNFAWSDDEAANL